MSSERLRRWRLVLGGGEADGIGETLGGDDSGRDSVLDALYGDSSSGQGGGRGSGLGRSSPRVARWLGDIRSYFPASVVSVLQRDAMERLGLAQLLLEPELLGAVQPDIHLVSTLLGLQRAIPEHSRETARAVVRSVTDQLEARLAAPTRQAVTGALHRAARTRRPKTGDIDWGRTVAANLRHYQPELGTVIPERLVGYGRRSPQVLREVILCLDQSGSMAASVVYASVFGAVLASVRSRATPRRGVDPAARPLTDDLDDPVDVLFGVQLGGGTDIAGALSYCAGRVTRPRDTVLVLVSDLFEGGDPEEMLRVAASLVGSGVTVVALLALSDDGAPAYDHDHAAAFAALGIPAFACTPDLFPDLMAAAIERRDLQSWTAAQGLHTAAPPP